MINQTKNKLNEKLVKKAFAYLEKKSDKHCVIVMEQLVGILREEERASALSVELYMRKFEGLMIGINRLDHKKINYTYCDEYIKELKEKNVRQSLTDDKDLHVFLPFLDLLEKYCDLASYMKEEVAIENLIEAKEHEIIENNKRIEANEGIIQAQSSLANEEAVNLQREQHRIFAEKEKRLA